MKRIAPTLASFAALATAQAASAQAATTCISEREVSQLAVYAVPAVIEGVRARCKRTLSADGFLATKGDAYAGKFAALQNETWPAAKSAITKFATSKADPKATEQFASLAALPDSAVRPLVDALVAQKIGEAVKTKDCSKIERGIQLVSPLGPRDGGALIGFLFTIIKPDGVAVCPARP